MTTTSFYSWFWRWLIFWSWSSVFYNPLKRLKFVQVLQCLWWTTWGRDWENKRNKRTGHFLSSTRVHLKREWKLSNERGSCVRLWIVWSQRRGVFPIIDRRVYQWGSRDKRARESLKEHLFPKNRTFHVPSPEIIIMNEWVDKENRGNLVEK